MKSLKPKRPRRAPMTAAQRAFWIAVRKCTSVADVIALAQSGTPRPYSNRLVEFLASQSIPHRTPPGEVERWRDIVELCAATTSPETLGLYRCVIAARLAGLRP